MPRPRSMPTAYEISRCPVCDSPEQEEIASSVDIRREVEQLWEFHLRRLRPAVPTERLFDRVVFSQRPPLRVGRCPECGTVLRDPRERERELVETYEGETTDPEVLRGLFETQRRSYRTQAERLTRFAGGDGTGLEVGSYVGAFLAAAREAGWRFEGVDVNPATNAFARGEGFRVSEGTLEDFDPERSYHAVAFWNCFDQLPNPRAAARAARAALLPGGTLAIRVPNGAFYAGVRPLLDGTLAGAAAGILAHSNLLGFPYRQGFTPTSLSRLLEEAGFEPIRVVGDALVPVADRWTRRWAVWEERAVKAALRTMARVGLAPWFEIYARAS